MTVFRKVLFPALALWLAGCQADPSSSAGLVLTDPATLVGERLFKETRFSQFFAAHATSVNETLGSGDPVMDATETLDGSLPGPFAGQSMNCSACHLVDQQESRPGGGIRTYGDFARRSPIPLREDGKTVTPRNSPPLVDATLPRNVSLFLHFDGEFSTIEDLVRGTLKGRNFGWLPTEQEQAVTQVARVLREDDGRGALASEFGGWSYKELLKGENPNISPALRLSSEYRIDTDRATDQDLLDAVAKLIGAYVDGLRFSKDTEGRYNASPYDVFLAKNGLPRNPNEGESDLDYSRRLLRMIEDLEDPKFLAHSDGEFAKHKQAFLFGERELEGLKVFLREPRSGRITGAGNCLSCHAAPDFTDFRFHNTGVTQKEFDGVHGNGAFAGLGVPTLAARQESPEEFLAPTAARPNGTGKFLAVPSVDAPENTDLGLWNVFANDDLPASQAALRDMLCEQFRDQVNACSDDEILPLTIAYFKTPSLRDLGHSAPYMHNGQFDTLEAVVEHYRDVAEEARSETLRNPSVELSGIRLGEEDVQTLSAFLKALNEDYE